MALIDFGLAVRDVNPSAGVFSGTLRYMPPEQMLGEPARKSADLFALGHVAFEILSGRPLFETTNRSELRNQIVECRIPDLSRCVPPIGEDLRGVLEQLLIKDPEKRTLDFDRVGSWAAPVDFDALVARRGG